MQNKNAKIFLVPGLPTFMILPLLSVVAPLFTVTLAHALFDLWQNYSAYAPEFTTISLSGIIGWLVFLFFFMFLPGLHFLWCRKLAWLVYLQKHGEFVFGEELNRQESTHSVPHRFIYPYIRFWFRYTVTGLDGLPKIVFKHIKVTNPWTTGIKERALATSLRILVSPKFPKKSFLVEDESIRLPKRYLVLLVASLITTAIMTLFYGLLIF